MSSLAELLTVRAAEEPDRVGFIFIAEGSAPEQRLTYGTLHHNARLLAANLLGHADPGDRALLYYPAGLDFLIAFFACAYAGIVAVPAVSPREASTSDHSLQPLAATASDCTPRLVLTTASVLARTDTRHAPWGHVQWLATDTLCTGAGLTDIRFPRPDELAFLQYTSGSTTTPKGVMISQRNLFANMEAVIETIRQARESVCVTWLPHFHDMGLGGLLGSLYGGYPCVFMSPIAFLARPLRWLRAITRYRGTWSGAPNFAFDLCCRHVRPADLRQLDLSSWEVLANGAEPVRKETIDRFIAIFAPVGFRAQALMPSYGLAEAVVFAAGRRERTAPTSILIDADALGRGHVIPVASSHPRARWHVACGGPAPLHAFCVVDPKARKLSRPGTIGEIWWTGPSVAGGYWRRPDESEQVFRATLATDSRTTYLRTGDLGFALNGEVVITGRLKDVIVVAGVNHFPPDIESTVEKAHAAIRPGGVAAFAIPADGDCLVVMAEIYNSAANGNAEEIMASIRGAVSEAHQLRISGIALMPPRTLRKTTSGKIRRHAMRELWLGRTADFVAQWRDGGLAALEAESQTASASQNAVMVTADGLESRMLAHIRRTLRAPDLVIDIDAPISQLGLSSIDIAELRATIEEDIGVSLSLSRMMDGTNLREILATLRDKGALAPRDRPAATRHPFEAIVNPEIGGLLRRLRLDRRFVHGAGSVLTDAQGRTVLDAIANYGAVPFGHNNAEIWQAVERVRAEGEPNLIQPSALSAAGELAERLLMIAPPGFQHVTFANSGAEVTEAALKLARAATGRRRLLSTDDGFHGKTLGALSVTGRSAYQLPFGAPVEDVEFIPFGDVESLERVLVDCGASFAAFIVEPLQGEAGIVEAPRGYLRRSAELCRRYGVKLIVDEIQTGLGRTGRLFACEDEGITPDMLLIAKALGGGLIPIGALLYQSSSYSPEFALKHTSTFAGNSLACRAGIAAIDLLVRDDGALVRRVAELGARMKSGLEAIAERFPSVLRAVRGRGFMLGLELSNRREDLGQQTLLGILAEQERLAALFASYLLNVESIRVAPTLLGNNVVRIEPPLTFTPEECDQVVAACQRAIGQLARHDTAAMINHLLECPHPHVPDGVAASPPQSAALRTPAPTWAFIAHPVDVSSYQHFDTSLNVFSRSEIAELAECWKGLIDPFVAGSARIRGVDAVASGQFLVVPSTAQELLTSAPADALGDIRAAINRAREAGTKVVGLGGYVSILTRGGLDLADAGVALTTGNTYTAIAAVAAIEYALGRLDERQDSNNVGIVGAGGSVGQTLCYLLARRTTQLMLLGNPAHVDFSLLQLRRTAETIVSALLRQDRRNDDGPFAERVRSVGRSNGRGLDEITAELIKSEDIVIGVDAAAMLPACDVVVSATSCAHSILRSEYFKPGAVVCDVSRPRNVADDVRSERPDVLVFEGGLVEVPQREDLGWRFGLPAGTAFACMCEPMILALESQYGAASRGAGLFVDYIDNLRLWGERNGFRLADLRSFDRTITEADWQHVRAARTLRRAAGAQAAVLGHVRP